MTCALAGGVTLNTVGALDLGGSSLEVTFVPPTGAAIADTADSSAVNLVGRFFELQRVQPCMTCSSWRHEQCTLHDACRHVCSNGRLQSHFQHHKLYLALLKQAAFGSGHIFPRVIDSKLYQLIHIWCLQTVLPVYHNKMKQQTATTAQLIKESRCTADCFGCN